MLEKSIISGFADEIDASFEVQLRVMGELGQKYLELRSADEIGIADFTDEKAKEIKRMMDAENVRVSAIGSPIGKSNILDDFEPEFEKFKRIVELAQHFETKNIRMFSFYTPEGEDVRKYRDEVFKRIGRMVDYAEKQNITLMHENEKGIYGCMATECLDLFKEFYGNHFQGIFDFGNYVQSGQDTLEAFEMLAPYTNYLHVKDAVRETGEVVVPGKGDGNLQEIIKRLDQADFTGFLSIEPHLFHFKGFDELERDNVSKPKESNSIQAYKAAHAGLLSLLQG